MEDFVNEVLGGADPNDCVRFAILSNNFDRTLNKMYQPRSNQYIDIDNDLTLLVQRVNIPRGNGLKRKLAVNMGLNIILKYCVCTAVQQYDDAPCFGYALALAIMLYKSKAFNPVDNVTVSDVCLLLHREHTTTPLTSLPAWFGRSYYCMKCEKHLKTRISTSVNQNTLVACVRKILACTCHDTQEYVKKVWCIRNITCFNNHKQMRYAHAQHRVKVWSLVCGPVSNHICESL